LFSFGIFELLLWRNGFNIKASLTQGFFFIFCQIFGIYMNDEHSGVRAKEKPIFG